MAAESVKVVVRCRPLNDREKSMNCKTVVSIDTGRCQCFIEKPGANEEPPKQFTFDGTYYTNQSTEQMYNEIAYPLVEVMYIFNRCVTGTPLLKITIPILTISITVMYHQGFKNVIVFGALPPVV